MGAVSLPSETDRPLEGEDGDEFGFSEIAKKLAPSLANATATDGMVIGIEGPWGSGKTSLLNFLRAELAKLELPNLHVITLAPWLSGDASSLVGALTSAIAEILEAKAEKEQQDDWERRKKQAADYADTLRRYGARTGRTIAPLVSLVGAFNPAAAAIGTALDAGAGYLESLGRTPTDAEVKKILSEKLAGLDERFLVFIDDLDRLEPHQAAEVIRMVRSVADFPKVAYVMCYDRAVLAHALEKSVHVRDGDSFLQKIVQLTFSIPLPEPFDLRLSLLERALSIYRNVRKREPEEEEFSDIRSAIDREGSGLRTPRDVKLVINAINFNYGNMWQDVDFADLCRVSLIKILQPPLYRWLENYLSLHSVIFTRDASVSEDEITSIAEQLKALLPSSSMISSRSIWSFSEFVPGVQYDENDPKKCVFQPVHGDEIHEFIRRRRLGSPVHYRNYFALTGPRTVLPDAKMSELLALASGSPLKLVEKFKEYLETKRPLGRNWFEHILSRLTKPYVAHLTAQQKVGFAMAIADTMDAALEVEGPRTPFVPWMGDAAEEALGNLISSLRSVDSARLEQLLVDIFQQCPSISWLVGGFFRTQLFDHGVIGQRAKVESDRILNAEELSLYKDVLKKRLWAIAKADSFKRYPQVANMLYGWKDIDGQATYNFWITRYIQDDDRFLDLLLDMRDVSVSDKIYRPLRKGSVEKFLNWETALERLGVLEGATSSEERKFKIAAIREALQNARNDFAEP